jgi:hypothetical protein
MAFFTLPEDADLKPEARQWLDALQRLRGTDTVPWSWRAYADSPRILKARMTAEENLFNWPPSHSAFSWEARNVAFMLVAHARKCEGCFGASRRSLTALGFDEPALDGICANPNALPLSDRERLFVKYVLQIAIDPTQLQPPDFREMRAQGLSREDVHEMIGFAAYAVLNTIFTTTAAAALRDD